MDTIQWGDSENLVDHLGYFRSLLKVIQGGGVFTRYCRQPRKETNTDKTWTQIEEKRIQG